MGGRCQPGTDGQYVLEHTVRADREGMAAQQEAEPADPGGKQGQAHSGGADQGGVGAAGRSQHQQGHDGQAKQGKDVQDPGDQDVQKVVGGADAPLTMLAMAAAPTSSAYRQVMAFMLAHTER
jgi:hypothetical protein